MSVVNLDQKLSTFAEHWSPKIISEFNGHDIMVVKAKGESSGILMRIPTTFSWF
jgi:hypothetical protein